MRNFLCGFIFCAALGLTGAAACNYITPDQGVVIPVLESLHFKHIPERTRTGGPQEFEATQKTHNAVKPGKRFILNTDATLTAK